jgi:hypothetical protein
MILLEPHGGNRQVIQDPTAALVDTEIRTTLEAAA